MEREREREREIARGDKDESIPNSHFCSANLMFWARDERAFGGRFS